MASNFNLSPATKNDSHAIELLLNHKEHVHRHLDWRSPLDWLGEQPYWIIESDYSIQAALACPEDPPGVAWIRFFAASSGMQLNYTWKLLFETALNSFQVTPPFIVSVAVQPWYTRLLLENGFSLFQTIVVLQLNTPLLHPSPEPDGVSIRKMQEQDLETVTHIDRSSFENIWQNSLDDTLYAFREAGYATIAYFEQKPVGYQISSATPFNAHLARLAVIPEMQRKGIGTFLTRDMIRYFSYQGIGYITVNTQSDNNTSLTLYRKLGFQLSNERFPVLRYEI